MKVYGQYIAIFFIFISAAACGKVERQVEYYKDGSKKLVKEFKEGKLHGKTSGFYMNGKKEFQQEYRQGQKHGKRTQWYEEGQVSAEGNFAQNFLHGPITVYYKNGKKKLVGEYKQGKEHGLWVRFFESGQKESEVEYKEGQFHGKWIEWDIHGQMTKNESYHEGFYEKPQVQGEYLGQDKPGLVPEIFAPGIVSTGYIEFGCTFSPDKKHFYFTRKEGDEFSLNYIYHMRQEKEGGAWSAPRPAAFSGEYDDIEPMITPDGRRLFFGSTRPLPPDSQIRPTDIWFMDWTEKGWSEPRNAGPNVNSDGREFCASATNDGTIYFAGYGKGGGDIFQSRFKEGVFSPREPLPAVINTDAQETHPFIASDGSYLIVESHPSMNRQVKRGLFISFRTAKNNWTTPQYMGRTINGNDGAGFPMVTPDGKFLFFTRDGDIYWVDSKVLEPFKSTKSS